MKIGRHGVLTKTLLTHDIRRSGRWRIVFSADFPLFNLQLSGNKSILRASVLLLHLGMRSSKTVSWISQRAGFLITEVALEVF